MLGVPIKMSEAPIFFYFFCPSNQKTGTHFKKNKEKNTYFENSKIQNKGSIMKRINIQTILLMWIFIMLFVAGCAEVQKQTRAIEINPGDAGQLLNKGVEHGSQGKFKEAKEEFEKALEVDPYSGGPKRYLRIIEYIDQQKIETRIAINYFKGIAYAIKGQWDKAIEEYNKVIERTPGFAEPYCNRGLVYYDKGRYDHAISDYTRAIEINPGYAEAYTNRGCAYGSKDKYDHAISDYTRAIEINPGDALACSNRGNAYFCTKNYEKAWDDVHKAQDLGYSVYPPFLKALREASGRER